jgi:hypothetical protein
MDEAELKEYDKVTIDMLLEELCRADWVSGFESFDSYWMSRTGTFITGVPESARLLRDGRTLKC